jgi:broad specificity phosphatase PhoE
VSTLILLRHGSTGETGQAFPVATGRAPDVPGAPLDDAGEAQSAALREHLPPVAAVWSSHARRAVQTAELAARTPDDLTADLAELDFGAWSGRTMVDVHRDDPAAMDAWLLDPEHAPTGGEPLSALASRVRAVMDRAAAVDGPVLAVTHGGLIRAAVTAVLGAPATASWALDVPPASVTVLHPPPADHPDDGQLTWRVGVLAWRPQVSW